MRIRAAEVERVRIVFTAPKGCPDHAWFVRAVRKRTTHFQLGGDSEPVRSFTASVARAEGKLSGRLEIRGPGVGVSVRDVDGKTCDEVVAALAFMTALAIDPSATNVPSPGSEESGNRPARSSPAPMPLPTPAPSSTPSSSPASASSTSPASTLAPSANPAAPSSMPATSSSSSSSSSPSSSSSSPSSSSSSSPPVSATATGREAEAALDRTAAAVLRSSPLPSTRATPSGWRWSLGVQGQSTTRTSPALGWGGLLFVEATSAQGSLLAPAWRAGLFIAGSDASTVSSSGARASFLWAAALLETCPLRVSVVEAHLALTPCLAAHLGVLRGEGQGLDQPKRSNDLWLDLGPAARLRWMLPAHLAVELEGMLVLPLHRPTFDVRDQGPTQPSTTLFAVPALGVLGGIGLAYEFP